MSRGDRPQRFLVTGAGGKTGRAVIGALIDSGAAVRAFVRDAEGHADLAARGDVEVVAGDQCDVSAVAGALAGCDGVYAIAPNVSPDEVQMCATVVAACRGSGVRRLVFHSVIDPYQPSMPHHLDKALAESIVRGSGLDWTILRPNAYLQNIDGYVDDLRSGTYRVPYASDRGLAMVDLSEVAEVASGALTGGLVGAIGATWELSGPAAVTPADVAREAALILDRPVEASRQDPDEWREANRDLPDDARRRLHAMFVHYDQHGCPGDATRLRALLGREPRDLRGYLAATLRSDSPGQLPTTGSRSAEIRRR